MMHSAVVDHPVLLGADLIPTLTAPLSLRFSEPRHRTPDSACVVWSTLGIPDRWCDECVANQHESSGRYGCRAVAQHCRTLRRRSTLGLCVRHAQAWRDRDRADGLAAPVTGRSIESAERRTPLIGDCLPYDVPDTLSNLGGPRHGPVTLPVAAYSAAERTFDLDNPPEAIAAYSAVVRNGNSALQMELLHADLLMALWSDLRLPPRCRQRWESTFPHLTERLR